MTIEAVSNSNWRVILRLNPFGVPIPEKMPRVIRLPVHSDVYTLKAETEELGTNDKVENQDLHSTVERDWPDSPWINSLHRRDVKALPENSRGVGTEG